VINQILEYKPEKENLWSGTYKIPWNEKEFSKRMLKMHLSQDHDMASRRNEIVEKQIQWIQNKLLKGKSSRILDLGCGPGLYVKKLANLGHECTGIDFSPASIEYARQICKDASFILGDVRKIDYGTDFDLAMFLFGELNVFARKECFEILKSAYHCLNPKGTLLLEVHRFDAIKNMGKAPKSWFRSGGNQIGSEHWFDSVMDDGLFSANPHIALVENNWLEDEKVALSNYWILEEGKDVAQYTNMMQGYTDQEYIKLLEAAGFTNIIIHDNFGEEESEVYQIITATVNK
jgi:ubiquinone/menaquinone biosynthesis C-methylase UbiE